MSVIHITFYKQKQKTETKSINQSKPNIFLVLLNVPLTNLREGPTIKKYFSLYVQKRVRLDTPIV
ncbi:hypothetical protein Hanom_Chr03g00268211 [Helianthus anomalus]